MTAEPRSLTVTSQAGMSNRLRVLLSGKALAQATDRAFAMCWRPHAACGCEFQRLFQNSWNVGKDVFFDTQKAYDLTRTAWNSYPEFLDATTPALYIQSYGWIIQPARNPRHAPLLARCSKWMNELEPVPEIARRVCEFQADHFRPTMIGVHLRRGDLTHRRPDVTANLTVAMRQVDVWLDAKNEAGILLCTDDGALDPYSGRNMPHEDIKGKFTARYGDRVVWTTPSSLDRRTPEAIQDGLVDLWLLRATSSFVGTVGSSFSELAVFGRDVPFVLTAAGSAVYENRMRWLKRLGLYERLARMGHEEFGRDVPYTMLFTRLRIRLRVLLTGRI